MKYALLSLFTISLLGACGKISVDGSMGEVVGERLEEWQDIGEEVKERVQTRLQNTPVITNAQIEQLVGSGTALPQLLASLDGNANISVSQLVAKLREMLPILSRAAGSDQQTADRFRETIEGLNSEFRSLSSKPTQTEIQSLKRRVRSLLLQFLQFALQMRGLQ